MSAAGKAAAEKGVSGRPRLADDKVKPNTLYQRARRARLKAELQLKEDDELYAYLSPEYLKQTIIGAAAYPGSN